MNAKTALELGRVSNLPTVWSNVVAGVVLAGGQPDVAGIAVLCLAMSAIYVGGMYLNDAFDAAFDTLHRTDRPIPSGRATVRSVRAIGFVLLAAGVALVGAHAAWHNGSAAAVVAALATAALVVVYDAWHKGNAIAPVLMASCRVGVYVTAGLSVAVELGRPLLVGCGALLAYVVGLSHVARHETQSTFRRTWPVACLYAPMIALLPLVRGPFLVRSLLGGFFLWTGRALDMTRGRRPDAIRNAVVSLIAGISLLDALLIAGMSSTWAVFAIASFLATLGLQRCISGT